jgi:hypothetical protein
MRYPSGRRPGYNPHYCGASVLDGNRDRQCRRLKRDGKDTCWQHDFLEPSTNEGSEG